VPSSVRSVKNHGLAESLRPRDDPDSRPPGPNTPPRGFKPPLP